MAKNVSTSKQEKQSKLLKACEITFVFGIIGTVAALLVSIAPVAIFLAGILLMFALVFIVLLCSVGTIFIIWASDGFKNFVDKFWSVTSKCFTGADHILDSVREFFPYIAIVIGVIVAIGFIVNLIGYLKYKNNTKQKKKFIAISIMFMVSMILITIGAILLYVVK